MIATNKNLKRIAVALSMIVLTLAGSIAGSFAWFASNIAINTEVSMFSVVSIDASIDSVKLYKFNYAPNPDGRGGFDYLFPEDGSVGEYSFNSTANKFGETIHNDETGEDEWVPVDTMNLYDPLNASITGRGLIGMNCNAIFKITLRSDGLANSSVNLKVKAFSIRETKSKEDDEIWLSTCVDFDYFTPASLSDPRLVTEGYKNYLPDQSNEYLPQNYVFAHTYEEDYYKISYLASLKDTHSHFYGGVDSTIIIADANVTFVDGYATIYVNVNYAPNQLKHYEDTVTPENTVRAVYDFLLQIS